MNSTLMIPKVPKCQILLGRRRILFLQRDRALFKKNRNCWDYFKDSVNRNYGYLLARIHTPKNLGINSLSEMKGPNSELE